MIHVKLPSKRKTHLTWLDKKYQHSVHTPSAPPSPPLTTKVSEYGELDDTDGPLYQEIQRRNTIIANKLFGCNLYVGEICKVKDANEKDIATYGEEVEIIKIMRNTIELDRPWPKDDDPFVIMFQNPKTKKVWVANPSFFVPK